MNTGSDSAFDEFINSPHIFDSFENTLPDNARYTRHGAGYPADKVKHTLSSFSHVESSYETAVNAASHSTASLRDALGFVNINEERHSTSVYSANNVSSPKLVSSAVSSPSMASSSSRVNTPLSPPFQNSLTTNTSFPRYGGSTTASFSSQPIPISPQLIASKRASTASPSVSHSLPAVVQSSYPDYYSTSPYMLLHQQHQRSGMESVPNMSPSMASSATASPNLSMSPTEMGHLSKKERNRLAAERCRRKKQELITTLSNENQQLQQENFELRKVNQVLEQKLDYLISVMANYGIPMPYKS